MSSGIIIQAFNNGEINYVKIAIINALMIKNNLKTNNITLMTTANSIRNIDKKLLDVCFENIIIIDFDDQTVSNTKIFKRADKRSVKLPWYNDFRFKTYELSPYDQTLLLDCDYLIQDNSLDQIWKTDHDIMVNKKYKDVCHFDRHSNTSSVNHSQLCWATAIKFLKNEIVSDVFDEIHDIYSNFKLYAIEYGINPKMYRNDFSFGIAIANNIDSLKCDTLPTDHILTAFDSDLIHDISFNNITLNVKSNKTSEYSKEKITDSVHIMNKYTILENYDKFIKIYG